jgi:hypothetical protein
MNGAAQFMLRDRLPMGEAVAPELPFGMDDVAECTGEILAHLAGDLDVRADEQLFSIGRAGSRAIEISETVKRISEHAASPAG